MHFYVAKYDFLQNEEEKLAHLWYFWQGGRASLSLGTAQSKGFFCPISQC